MYPLDRTSFGYLYLKNPTGALPIILTPSEGSQDSATMRSLVWEKKYCSSKLIIKKYCNRIHK